MAARITITSLSNSVDERIGKLVAEIEALKAEVAALKAGRSVTAVATKPAYVPPPPTPIQVAYRTAREAYKQRAIAAMKAGEYIAAFPSFAEFERNHTVEA